MDFKYILFVLMFLLIMPIAYANEIKVLYFFGSSCEFSQIEEANIKQVKLSWEGIVNWNNYDLDNKSNIQVSRKYNITGIPAAIVECLNSTIKIDRKDVYFSQIINQTIHQCQSLEANGKVEIIPAVFILAFGCLIAIYLAKKHLGKRRLKRRFKKRAR